MLFRSAAEIGGMSPVLVVGALLGQMKLVKPLAAKAGTLFGLSADEIVMLNEVPHRGAPIQRLLATVARGARSFNWYNYGPPYAQGDEFTGVTAEPLMMEVAKAARILGAAEEIVHEACHEQPKAAVAVLYPRTTHDMRRGIGHTNHFQDVKWVWTALQHDHVPVDVVSETAVEEGDLEGRKALYVVGSHVPAKAQRAIAAHRDGRDLDALACVAPALDLEDLIQPARERGWSIEGPPEAAVMIGPTGF